MVEVIRRLSLLNEAARAMSSLMDPDELLDRILDMTREVFGFDACALLLVDESGNELQIRRARGYDAHIVESFRGRAGEGVTGRAMVSDQPVVETDVSHANGYVAGVPGAVAEVAVPLRLDSTVIGVLDAESTSPLSFSKEDLSLLTSFASHAAAVVNNAQLHADLASRSAALDRKLEIQRLLGKAADVMLGNLAPEAVLDEILALAKQALHFETCAVLMLEDDAEHLVLRAAHGYRNDWRELKIPVGRGITGKAVQSGQPVLVTDVSMEPGYIEGVSGGRCEMAIPLAVKGEIIGVLDAEAREPGAFTADDVETFTAFANHAAVALRNAKLHARLQAHRIHLERRLELQGLIAQASEVMLSSLTCDEVLSEILGLAKKALHFETCAVLLLQDDQQQLELRAAHGYRDDWRELRITVGEGVTGRTVQSGEPVLVPDVTTEPGYIEGVSGGRCELAVPLRVRDRIIGVLDVEAQEPDAFTEDDVETLVIFSHYAAVALRNAAQVERIGEQKRTLESQLRRQALVKRAGEAVRSTLQEEELLRRILGIAREALEFRTCAALLLDDDGDNLRLHAALGYGRDVSSVVVPAGQGITGAALEQRQPVLVEDVTQDPRYIEGMTGGRCEMVAPLQVDGEVIGVLDAEADEVSGFDAEDLALFQIFASDVAVAIRNARQFAELERANATLEEHVAEIERMNEELSDYAEQISRTNEDLEKRVRELGTVYEASQTITSSLDLNETLQSIVDMTRVIINASSGAIRLLDEETEELRSRAVSSGDIVAVDPGEPPPSGGAQLQTPLRVGDRTIGVFELGRERGDFSDEEKRMLKTLASQAAIAIDNSRLFERTQRTYYETIRALAEALEARDAYTRGHSERVTRYAIAIAEAMDFSRDDLKIIEHAGLLHDIGKIGISDTILHKTSQLSAEDRKVIETHPIFGDTILGPIKFLNRVQDIVKHHHERYDGTGYPDGLQGEGIPLSARIVCVADSYDAMTSDRPYRPALARDEAIGELRKHQGSQFDPQIVLVFIRLLETRFPA